MSKRSQQFQTIRTEGALLPPDIMQLVASLKVDGANAESYHLPPSTKINESISQAWNVLRQHWQSFQTARQKLSKNVGDELETGTSITNTTWLLPLFKELDYGRLVTSKSPVIDERTYPIERFYNKTPIHFVGCQLPLDRRTRGARGAATASPHSMVQEFLNRSSENLWAFLSNGLQLRLLRDNVSLSRQAFIEFDLESMMEGEVYSDFAILWLLCHQSRVEADKPEECWLEKWSKLARDQGTRILNDLRNGVTIAIEALGQGFIGHPRNDDLRDKLRSGTLSRDDYYRQLLRIVYRLLFLFVAEDRELLHPPDANDQSRNLYDTYYSSRRLRDLAFKIRGSKHSDLWHSLAIVFDALGKNEGCLQLGLHGLGSFLWRSSSTPDLLGPATSNSSPVHISNEYLLRAIRALAYVQQNNVLRVVDYRNLGTEELGSVYESLLELHPAMHIEAKTFELTTAAGNERKITGSYYTPDSLVQCLLDSALEPVVEERLKEVKDLANRQSTNGKKGKSDLPDWFRQISNDKQDSQLGTGYSALAEAGLLALKVCDPACGSGHFLIAAAHRLARHLARVRSADGEPTPDEYQHALRDVIGRCVYGVDINPMAIELCKVSLWMEAMEPGKPLSFLDHHIKCGNSLLGTTPALLKQGIPDDAFKPIEGDDKKVTRELLGDNRRERRDRASGQLSMFQPFFQLGNLPSVLAGLSAANDDTVDDISRIENRYAELVLGADYLNARLLADTWCSVFVWKKEATDLGKLCPTEREFRMIEDNPHSILPHVKSEIRRLSDQYQFFHWHLAFPDVFRLPENGIAANEQTGWSGGVDVLLGNPPWEKLQTEELQFFSALAPYIAELKGAKRKAAIRKLQQDDPNLASAWKDQRRIDASTVGFIRQSSYYPKTGVGKFNTYALFAELNWNVVQCKGRVGCIVPTGIATDDTTKLYFQSICETNSLVSLFDFENRMPIFPGVHRMFKFALLTVRGKTSGFEATPMKFAFFMQNPTELQDKSKSFELSSADIALLNPNTRNCPIFRLRQDAELARHVYRRIPILSHETDSSLGSYSVRAWRLINTTDDSEFFVGIDESRELVPLIEAKMIHQFDHRYASFPVGSDEVEIWGEVEKNDGSRETSARHYLEPDYFTSRLPNHLANQEWFLTVRNITNASNERTVIAVVIPRAAGCEVTPYVETNPICAVDTLFLLAGLNSYSLDYISRQKVGGTHLSYFILYQLPMVHRTEVGATLLRLINSLALELTYTAWDLRAFALDCRYDGPPFRWIEERRFLMRCELDAAYFHLYLGTPAEWGTDSPQLREMFPTPRHAVDYIMETFPIVKRKDIKRTEIKNAAGEVTTPGTYITKETILEIYDEMAEAIQAQRGLEPAIRNEPEVEVSKSSHQTPALKVAEPKPQFRVIRPTYQTRLNPPPGPPTDSSGNFIPMSSWDKSNWPSHIHQPKTTSTNNDIWEQGEFILFLRLLLRRWGVPVRRDVLELALLFCRNAMLRRRIIDGQPVASQKKMRRAPSSWIPNFDRELKALVKNQAIELSLRNSDQFFILLDGTELDTRLATSFAPSVDESIEAFQRIKDKRELDAIEKPEIEGFVMNHIEESELATLDTF